MEPQVSMGLPSLCLIPGTLERAKRRSYYVQSVQRSTLGEQGMKREMDERDRGGEEACLSVSGFDL